jgi:hypothetical protein
MPIAVVASGSGGRLKSTTAVLRLLQPAVQSSSSLHFHLKILNLFPQPLHFVLRHHLRANIEVVYHVLQASYQRFDLGALSRDGRQEFRVRLLCLDEFGVHFGGLLFEEGHEMGEVNLRGRQCVRTKQSVSTPTNIYMRQYPRNGRLYRPAICAQLSALLPQLRILNTLIQRIEELDHIPPLHDVVEVGLPCPVQLVDDLPAQVVQHLGAVLRSGWEARCKVLRGAFVQCRLGGLVEDVDEALCARAGRVGDGRSGCGRWRARMGLGGSMHVGV